MVVSVDRAQVMAYRLGAHGLDDRTDTDPAALGVLDLGVQDTPYGSAATALAARTTAPPGGLELVWAARGAPHLHRVADLPALTAALWPFSDGDATARITSSAIKEGAKLGAAAFAETAKALRAVVTGPMAKGEVSTEVSALVPPSLTYWCRVCQAQHISGSLFQQAGLFGGTRLVVEGNRTVLAPLAGPAPQLPDGPGDPARIVHAYLRLHGPGTLADVAAFLGTKQGELRRVWPGGLTAVRVGGVERWLPDAAVPLLESATIRGTVRLLPPGDPLLQGRDREILVPDPVRRKEVWRVLGNPGAVLSRGEIVGVWRPRKKAATRLEIQVTAFEPLSPAVRDAVHEEAGRVAAARGVDRAEAVFSE